MSPFSPLSHPSRLNQLILRQFRSFGELHYEPGPGLNFITGANAQGKTSILEAACVLLRLRSPRTTNIAEAVRFANNAFALEGLVGNTRLSLTFTPPVRSLRLDGVPQSGTASYLSSACIVWFGGGDLSLVSGPAERRRKLLDSAGLQLAKFAGSYGRDLKNHDRAMRARNLLLREGKPRREIEAYNAPFTEAGERIMSARAALVEAIAPLAASACLGISGEKLELAYLPGAVSPLAEALEASRDEEIRLRQTRVGPQRDDMAVLLNGIQAGSFASEGQRRTVALALKLAVASLLARENLSPPLLLLDDIFGELDPSRREALLCSMPPDSQALLTTADLSGTPLPSGAVAGTLQGGSLHF